MGILMSVAKSNNVLKFGKNWGWMAHSPCSIALVFTLVTVVLTGSAVYYVEYTRAPGEPSPFISKCNMWHRC